MLIIGACVGALGMYIYLEGPRLHEKVEASKRVNHPTSVVTPESLHESFLQVMTDTVFAVKKMARDADMNEWYWSHDYYKRQAFHMESVMLPYDYYVKGDLKKTPYSPL